MAASAKSRRACGPSFVFLASARSCDALKSPRNDTGIDMTNLHRSPPMNQSETDLGIVNESQLLGFGIRHKTPEATGLPQLSDFTAPTRHVLHHAFLARPSHFEGVTANTSSERRR